MTKLSELKVGESGVIVSVNGDKSLRGHLLDMGLTPNTCVRVSAMAPMGDPIEINLRGYRLTIRLDDASNIEVMKEKIVCNGNCRECLKKVK
ncbi:MAG: ferrous iron transport protein A [Clostridia bacterium]|nr:ferrous iron transport protein A [Clostridia bacterium]